MMTDRELLEMAAKAYWGDEIDDVCSIRWLDAEHCIGYTHGSNQDRNGLDVEYCWNPLTDDGAAMRLAVKLRLLGNVEMTEEFICAAYQDDQLSWTRRAIVCAAAEIGRAI